jgi:hypothetical protein
MTFDEAIAAFRARWAHAPVDRRDVEERVALRLLDRDPPPTVVVLSCLGACRVFAFNGKAWRSRYVHELRDVDALVDDLVRFAEAA